MNPHEDSPPSIVAWPIGAMRHVSVQTTHVFPVTPYSRLLLTSMPDVVGKDVMDFGSGSGIVGIVAARLGASSVLACDVSAEALSLTGQNAERNGVEGLETHLVKLERETEHIPRDSFDVILCNPASLPTLMATEGFWSGGPRGNRMILALIDAAARTLRSEGVLRFVHTSLASLATTFQYLTRQKFTAGIIKVERIPFRPHYQPLLDHFIALRAQGHIYFEGSTLPDAHEYLYIIDARRITLSSPPGGDS